MIQTVHFQLGVYTSIWGPLWGTTSFWRNWNPPMFLTSRLNGWSEGTFSKRPSLKLWELYNWLVLSQLSEKPGWLILHSKMSFRLTHTAVGSRGCYTTKVDIAHMRLLIKTLVFAGCTGCQTQLNKVYKKPLWSILMNHLGFLGVSPRVFVAAAHMNAAGETHVSCWDFGKIIPTFLPSQWEFFPIHNIKISYTYYTL